MTVSFYDDANNKDRNSSLTFYLARYHMNGTFLGFQMLKNQLNICPFNYEDVQSMLKFGTVTEDFCHFDLSNLISDSLPQDANIFFELFILDRKANLIDVPVLIRNFNDSKLSTPNTGTFNDHWRLFRRFFIFDTISGIDTPNGYKSGAIPKVVRWASSIKFKITLDLTSPEKIYTPYIEIVYRERQTNMIHSTTKAAIEFVMDYYQDMTLFWKSIMIAFIIFQVLIFIIIAMRMYYFTKQNPRALLGEKFTSVFFKKLPHVFFDVWSSIMFWILFFTTAYWFITFKLQANAYVLLPSIDDWGTSYLVFDTIFGLVLAFRFISIIMSIFEQSNIDIFLIDWEPAPDATIQKPSVLPKDNIVVWRSVFVANELNELQSQYRYFKPETTLIWFVFFIKALGWEELAQANPDMVTKPSEFSPINYVLKFFVSAFLFLCIMAAQYLVELVNAYVNSLKFQEFIDLCSVSNISVLMMDQYYHGYYIHGKAPWGRSDLVMRELKEKLDSEAEGVGRRRGLPSSRVDNNRNLNQEKQTFEIYFPAQLRDEYDLMHKERAQLNLEQRMKLKEKQLKMKSYKAAR